MSPRKQAIRRLQDELASERARWLERGAFFHQEDLRYLKFLIPEGARVLELGCGNGHLLAALKPSFGVGVDFSGGMIVQARKNYPNLSFVEGDLEDEKLIKSLPGPFDVILLADTLGALDDCQQLFDNLHDLCTRETRFIVAYFSHLWYPAVKLAEALRLRMPQPAQNVLISRRHSLAGRTCRFRNRKVRNSTAGSVPVARAWSADQPFHRPVSTNSASMPKALFGLSFTASC